LEALPKTAMKKEAGGRGSTRRRGEREEVVTAVKPAGHKAKVA